MKPYTDSDRWRADIKHNREMIRRLKLARRDAKGRRDWMASLRLLGSIHERELIISGCTAAIAAAKAAE